MSRKDYEMIAACFKEARLAEIREGRDPASVAGPWNFLRRAIALELSLDNPRFDDSRFQKACIGDIPLPQGIYG